MLAWTLSFYYKRQILLCKIIWAFKAWDRRCLEWTHPNQSRSFLSKMSKRFRRGITWPMGPLCKIEYALIFRWARKQFCHIFICFVCNLMGPYYLLIIPLSSIWSNFPSGANELSFLVSKYRNLILLAAFCWDFGFSWYQPLHFSKLSVLTWQNPLFYFLKILKYFGELINDAHSSHIHGKLYYRFNKLTLPWIWPPWMCEEWASFSILWEYLSIISSFF